MALIDDLLGADQAVEILRHVARATWAKAHDGAECPPEHIPAPADLATFVCLNDVLIEVCTLDDAVGWLVRGKLLSVPLARDVLFGERTYPEARDNPTDAVAWLVDRLHYRWQLCHSGEWSRHVAGPDGYHIEAGTPAKKVRHPFAPVVDAWQRRPMEAAAENRADRRIMPMWRVVGPAPERERGLLFGGLVEDRPSVVDLPLFPELEPELHRVPLLEIVDATGVPLRSQGKGAPIEARLIVRGGLLMIRPEDRDRGTVRIAVTVGELLDSLYPPSAARKSRRTAENWPKIEAALRTARDFTVTDVTGSRWFPMALRRLPADGPDGTPALEDLVVIDLAPPPGATTGPSVDLPALDRMGVSSGPKWYAYIAGRSLVWQPGTTRRPVPKGGGQWGWSRDPNNYPVLTLADLRRFAFGTKDAKNRTRAEILKPWSNLPDVVLVPNQTDARTGIRGYRLLPAEATAAVHKVDAKPGER